MHFNTCRNQKTWVRFNGVKFCLDPSRGIPYEAFHCSCTLGSCTQCFCRRRKDSPLPNDPTFCRLRLMVSSLKIVMPSCSPMDYVGKPHIASRLAIPRLVIPRAHDCITLYLGSRQRYLEQFNARPGTYWYSLDYLERYSGDKRLALLLRLLLTMPTRNTFKSMEKRTRIT